MAFSWRQDSDDVVLLWQENEKLIRVPLKWPVRKDVGNKSDPLKKAMGKIKHPKILDATAGLLFDAHHFYQLGAEVTACESNSNLAEALQTAIKPSDIHILAVDFLTHSFLDRSFDILYLDPMFPQKKKKSALPGKEAQILQKIGKYLTEAEEEALLAKAKKIARNRVIVKRPIDAPQLASSRPDFSIKGKTVRYDIYLVNDRI